MATIAKKAVKAVKAAKAEAEPKKRGRVGQYAGKKLRKTVKEWPGREGTAIAASFALITNGMKYEAFIAAGGRYIDVVDAVKQGHLVVE